LYSAVSEFRQGTDQVQALHNYRTMRNLDAYVSIKILLLLEVALKKMGWRQLSLVLVFGVQIVS